MLQHFQKQAHCIGKQMAVLCSRTSFHFYQVSSKREVKKRLLAHDAVYIGGPTHAGFVYKVTDCHMFQCCFTSTETIRLIRDGRPRTATSTFPQLLSSVARHEMGHVFETQTSVFKNRMIKQLKNRCTSIFKVPFL